MAHSHISKHNTHTHKISVKNKMDWRDDSVVKTLVLLLRTQIVSQHPHGGSKASVTPVPGDSGLILTSKGT